MMRWSEGALCGLRHTASTEKIVPFLASWFLCIASPPRVDTPCQSPTLKPYGKNCWFSYSGEVKLYLDNSFLNRPFDDPLVGMNKDESSVLFNLIRLAKEGRVQLVRSAMIEVENTANQIVARKSFVQSVMHLA